MSWFRCKCNHVIDDKYADLPYKGYLYADQDQDRRQSAFEHIADFVTAREHGMQEQFLTRFFGEPYPKDLNVAEVVSDIFDKITGGTESPLYECEQCGRLWLDSNRSETLLTYQPEQETRGVLNSAEEEK
jgi:hypothetical protein